MTVILDLSVTLAAPSPGAAPEVLASIALRCDALELSHRAICSLTPHHTAATGGGAVVVPGGILAVALRAVSRSRQRGGSPLA